MTETKLYINSDSTLKYNYSSGERYGDWEQTWIFSLVSASLTDLNGGGDTFTVDYEVNDGDTVYVLYMIYSDGDSFGHSEGKGEVIWVFKDYNVAKTAAEVWEKYRKETIITILSDTGQKLELYNCSAGFFERMTSINIDPLVVNSGSYRKVLR